MLCFCDMPLQAVNEMIIDKKTVSFIINYKFANINKIIVLNQP